MSLYRYTSSSLVDEINFVTTENGGIRAYLHARDGASQEELLKVTETLKKENWLFLPLSEGEHHALEVRGFYDEKELTRKLAKHGFVEGKPQIEKPKEDSHSWWEMIQKRSLQVSGLLYLVGDFNFIQYGRKEGNTADIVGGIFYLLGTLVLIGYGRNDQADLQMQKYAQALHNYLGKENLDIPNTCSLETIADDSHKSFLRQCNDWVRSHPAEVFNTIYIGAGASIALAALRGKIFKTVAGETAKDAFQRKTAGWMDFALGTTTATVSLLGNVIEEKKPDPDDPPPRNFIDKAWRWVREKPLRLTGYGLMASTMFHAGSTGLEFIRARRTNDTKTQSALLNRATFVGTNLGAEGLLAISSKGHGEGVTNDESVKESVIAMAAELIVKQPKEKQETLIQHLGSFLQQPDLLAESYNIVEQKLRAEIGQLEKNPWLCLTKTPTPEIYTPPAPEPAVPLAREPKVWAERVPAASARNAELPQPGMSA